jgi:arylsulfatase A-like enzyme
MLGRPLATAVALVSGAVSLLVGCGARREPPDILLLTVDTLRPDYLSFNGYPLPTSPYLDGLLSESWYFDQALTPIARTTPAFASMFTGAYPHATGVRTLTSDLRPEAVTLAEALGELGYLTVAIPTSFVMPPRRGLDQGFDHYGKVRGLDPAEVVTANAIAAIGALDGDRPIFAWVHYVDPHNPYEATIELLETFDPDYQGPYRERFALQDLVLEKAGVEPGKRTPEEVQALHEVRATVIHRSDLPEPVKDHVRRLYAASIRHFDDHLPPLIEAMRARQGGDPIIVFTADHGESLGEHDFHWDHGDYVYQAGNRVPLAFHLPPSHPLRGAGRCPERVSILDVVPTLFELIERPVPEAMRGQIAGRSLVPCMRGEALPDLALFAETGRSLARTRLTRQVHNTIEGRIRSVVIGDWKLIWTPFQTGDLEWELYDLAEDPDETRNLYRPDHPQVKRLESALRRWLAEQPGAESLPEIGEEDFEGLRALGYVQ